MDKNLDKLLADAAMTTPDLGDDLMARLMQDMQANVPVPEGTRFEWRMIWPLLGGWPSLAGLATATIAGIWIGVSPPDMILNASDALIGEQALYLDDVFEDGLWALDLAEEGTS